MTGAQDAKDSWRLLSVHSERLFPSPRRTAILRGSAQCSTFAKNGMAMARERLIGKTLGDFEIESLIGSGAMGKVYRATQISLRRPVAIKVMEEGVFTPDEVKLRFRREAEYVARLEHPHIVSIYQFGHEDHYAWYAMRLVDGKSFEHDLVEGIALAKGLRHLADIADALGYAHQQRVIHRDIKPANILIAGQVAYLADFGLARLLETSTITASGALLGTLLYMAPEQVRRERATEASDLYALGVILYELVTTRHPFVESTPSDGRSPAGAARLEVVERISKSKFLRPSEALPGVPPLLEEIILRAMAPMPTDRYPNARAFQRDLQRCLSLPDLIRIDTLRAGALGHALPNATTGAMPTGVPTPELAPVAGADAQPRVQEYRLLEEVRRDERGVLHKAVHEPTSQVVHLWVTPWSVPAMAEDATHWRMDIASAAALRHPNIRTLHRAGEHEGKVFLVNDPAPGETLAEALNQGRLPARRALEVVRDVARGLEHAHATRVLHLRLDPACIWLDSQGRALIGDFALAALREDRRRGDQPDGTTVLPPACVAWAPEQMRPATDRNCDVRTDVFQLGALLYRLLAGTAPWPSPAARLAAIESEPVSLSALAARVHPDVSAICMRALAVRPEDRFASAEALRVDLEAVLNGELPPSLTGARTAPSQLRGEKTSSRRALGLLVTGVIALVVIGTAWFRHERSVARDRTLAELEWRFRTGATEADLRAVVLAPAPGTDAQADYWRARALFREWLAQRRLPSSRPVADGITQVAVEEGLAPPADPRLLAALAAAESGEESGDRRSLIAGMRGVIAGSHAEARPIWRAICDRGVDGWEVAFAAGWTCMHDQDFAGALTLARGGLSRWRGDERLSELAVRALIRTGWGKVLKGSDPASEWKDAGALVDVQCALGSPDALWGRLRAEVARLSALRESRFGGDADAAFLRAIKVVPADQSVPTLIERGETLLTLAEELRRARPEAAVARAEVERAEQAFRQVLAQQPGRLAAEQGLARAKRLLE